MTADQRPDPDRLLDRVHAEEARARLGKLKIFFGASAGVGKTCAMLGEARQQAAKGVDVVIGSVETHGRAETQRMADGLPALPARELVHRHRVLREFDLDGALKRRPGLILMDELAHSNVAGSRHAKRWQDIDELLAAGIDVYSTVNVQHLESLNDVISGITGIRVWETVPDKVFDSADEVVLVDLPPDELLQRLQAGKVYLPHQAERAIRNFFRKGNLIALRELALRRTADRVDDEMLQYRREQAVAPVWQTRDSLLACVGTGGAGERIVRTTARIASRLEAPWHAVYVETPALQRLSDSERHRVLRLLKLAEELGASTAVLAGSEAAAAVVDYARTHNLAKIVVGRDRARRWRPPYRSFAERLGQAAPEVDVIQVAGGAAAGAAQRAAGNARLRHPRTFDEWPAYGKAAAACAVTGMASALLLPIAGLPGSALVLLLGVVLVGARAGRGPALLAAVLVVALLALLVGAPHAAPAGDLHYPTTAAVMLVVGLIAGQLTAASRYQAKVARRRERRISALYQMSRDLSAALLPEEIARIGTRFVVAEFGARAAFLLTDDKNRLQPALPAANGLPAIDMAIAQWALDHQEAAGPGSHTLVGSPLLYLPLKAPMRARGVLALEVQDADRLLIPEQQRLLDTFASLIAIALERVHYVAIAQETTVQMASERLRNSVLAALSHDLRTPLGVLVGLAEAISGSPPPPADRQAEIARALKEEALRVSSQVNNLLEMARLQSGPVQLNRQWLPLDQVVGGALQTLQWAFREHRIKVSLGENLPLVNIDPVLLERVVYNLLENTVKFTPAGSSVEVGAQVGETSIAIWVADNGPGLPKGREEIIFKKFERGRPADASQGVGLGLAICRAIVEAHGGEIRAENRPSGGARFIFTLPREIPPAPTESVPERAQPLP
ncbi:MAG TPA: ATP-binding protein [Accumulibacter sp.]|uniref:ATP-binding protein n=1 Tax=Accumulibacter sp. TaxID=2053492 RepID=UPI002D0D87CE|nr:ATP-binding protein [Accumulibacter sp.]HND38496.1 ATP-binding protein [Accumulibacter sp.]HNH92155.1 ATP-binding protein [Accumulibacter sp.]